MPLACSHPRSSSADSRPTPMTDRIAEQPLSNLTGSIHLNAKEVDMPDLNRVSDVTAVELRDRAYRLFADRVAIIDGTERVTYRDLGRLANSVAATLLDRGHARGERILLICRNRAGFLAVEHGIARGGFVRVALSARLHPTEVAYVVANSGATAAFVDEEWARHIEANPSEFAGLRTIVCLDSGTSFEHFDDFSKATTSALDLRFPEPTELSTIWYTSGTTGKPKGAMMTHGAVTAVIRHYLVQEGPPADDEVVLHIAPLSHMSGVWGAPYFLFGATHVVCSKFEPAKVLEDIDEHGVTMIPMVPTMLHMVVDAAIESGYRTSSVRTILYGGSPISPDKLSRAVGVFGQVFIQLYGMGEFPAVSHLRRQHHVLEPGEATQVMGSAGQPLTFVQVKLQGQSGETVPTGQEGEILVRGDLACSGYWGNAAATQELVDAEGWLHTGDVGRFDAQGFLYVVDRKKEMIVSGGFNVYPNEVENAISALEDVAEVAVIAVPDDRWGEAVAACVVLRAGSSVTEDDIRNICRERVASYKVPKHVEFLDVLPKNGVGKIMRRTLREERWAGHDRRVG